MANLITAQPELDQYGVNQVDSMLQSFLIEESVMLSKITDRSSKVKKGDKSHFIPTMAIGDVKSKTQKADMEADEAVDGGDLLIFDKHKYMNYELEDEADEKSIVDSVQGWLERASKKMALQIDKDIIAELQASAAAANTFSQIAATMGKADAIELRRLMRKQFIRPQELRFGINPDKEAELLSVADFVSADIYGKSNPSGIESGILGTLYGVPVFVHEEIDPDFSLFFHQSALAYAAVIQLRYQTDYRLKGLSRDHAVDMLYGVKGLDSGVRAGVITAFVP